MAWLDDRVWCHPKFTELSDHAGWVWAKALAYSAGMGTGGLLAAGQQRLVGMDAKARNELVAAGLVELHQDGVLLHHWDDWNGKRDERRQRERERKRLARLNGQWQETDRPGVRPVRAPESAPSLAPGCVEGSEGSEGSEGKRTRAVVVELDMDRTAPGFR